MKKAKESLEKHGYQVHNLWNISDVKSKYNCTNDEAMKVLIQALTNDATMEQIWYAISFHAEESGLKENKEDEQ